MNVVTLNLKRIREEAEALMHATGTVTDAARLHALERPAELEALITLVIAGAGLFDALAMVCARLDAMNEALERLPDTLRQPAMPQ